jgi:hypothetical protein
MPEHDCSKHLLKTRVSLNPSKLEKSQHYNLIAALLRQIADYTDGWCATEYAKDADLAPSKAMTFYFTSEEKRTQFDNRISIYLRKDINDALTRTEV